VPIENYERLADRAETRIFDDPEIEQDTKRILRRFLTVYDVSSARRAIFLVKVRPFLQEFQPLESALTERDHINDFFADLRKRYSPATYATYISVIQKLLTWMNGGSKPDSMQDIHKRKGKHIRRNLKPEDMITWEEGVRLSDSFCNTQLKAAVQIQLDCGLRPSEFIDLNCGDIEVHKGLAVIHVRDGKTGSRSVVAHRCIPALLSWMEAHPTKRSGDPLWIFESNIKSGSNGFLEVTRYRYPALAKRIRTAGRKLGINKPLDFYNLRHSSCVLDKMDNLPVDLAAERHGHSVKHFVGTYGRLSVQDVMRRFNSHYGMAESDPVKKIEHQTCPTCSAVNSEHQDWCSKCGTPLSTKGALETAQKNGVIPKRVDDTTRQEIAHLKAELSASREREQGFMREQLQLLNEMREVRSAISGGSFNPGR
jgi:integrase